MSAKQARGKMAKLLVGVMVLNLIPLYAMAQQDPGKSGASAEASHKLPTRRHGPPKASIAADSSDVPAPSYTTPSMTLEEMSDPVSGFGGFNVDATPNSDKRDAAQIVSLVGMVSRSCVYDKNDPDQKPKITFKQIKIADRNQNISLAFQLDDQDGSIRSCMKKHPSSECNDTTCIDIKKLPGAIWNLSKVDGRHEIGINHDDLSRPEENGRHQFQSAKPSIIHTGQDILQAQDDKEVRDARQARIDLAQARFGRCRNTLADVSMAKNEALYLKSQGILGYEEYEDAVKVLNKRELDLEFQDLKKQATSAGVDNLALLRDDLQSFAENHREYSSQVALLFESLASRAMGTKDFKLSQELVAEAGNLPELDGSTHARLQGDTRSISLAKIQTLAQNGYQNNFMLMPELYATAQSFQQEVMKNCTSQQSAGMSVSFGSSVMSSPVQAPKVDNTAQMETCANAMQALRSLNQIPQQAMAVDTRQQQMMQSIQAMMNPQQGQQQGQQMNNPFASGVQQPQVGFGTPGLTGPAPLPMGPGGQSPMMSGMPGMNNPMMASNYGGFNPAMNPAMNMSSGYGPSSLYGGYNSTSYNPMAGGMPSSGRF